MHPTPAAVPSFTLQDVPLAAIIADGSTQARVVLVDPEVVEDYAKRMREGEDFPPLDVFREGDTFWMADGHHRLRAAQAIERESIPARVHLGTRRDALLHSIRSNQTHGLRLTREDKRKAVDTLVLDPVWREWSDNSIAKLCGVDPHTVKERRARLGVPKTPTVTFIRGGESRKMNAEGIGRRPSATPLLDALRFVQSAVSKGSITPALAHLRIDDGRVFAYDGVQALSAPIGYDLPPCAPRAREFIDAVRTCGEPLDRLTLLRDGRVEVVGGGVSVRVDCYPGAMPEVPPTGGDLVDVPPDLLPTLRTLAPFISRDASRPFLTGVRFRGDRAYATNDIILAERVTSPLTPDNMNIRVEAISLLLASKEAPSQMQADGRSVTFHFPSGRWMRSQLLDPKWPDAAKLLDVPHLPAPIPEGFFDAVERLVPFIDSYERVWLYENRLSTGSTSSTSVEVPGVREGAVFNARQLLLLRGVAQTLDTSAYPGRCPFAGDGVRGVIAPVVGFSGEARFDLKPVEEPAAPSSPPTEPMPTSAAPPWVLLADFAEKHGLELREVDGVKAALVRAADLVKFRS